MYELSDQYHGMYYLLYFFRDEKVGSWFLAGSWLHSATSSWSNLSKNVSSDDACAQFSGNTYSVNFPVIFSAAFISFPVGKY